MNSAMRQYPLVTFCVVVCGWYTVNTPTFCFNKLKLSELRMTLCSSALSGMIRSNCVFMEKYATSPLITAIAEPEITAMCFFCMDLIFMYELYRIELFKKLPYKSSNFYFMWYFVL